MQKLVRYTLILLITINFLYCISGVLHFPLASIDEVSIWLIKAKLFFMNGILPLNQLNSLQFSHPQYPILLPLLFLGITKLTHSFNEVYFLIFYPFIYLLIVFLCYKSLRLFKCSVNVALIYAYIFSMLSPLLAMGGRMHAGEADIFIVLASWFLVIIYIYYYKDASEKWLILLLVTIMIASGIKMEGVFLSVIFLFIPISRPKKVFYFTLSLLPLVTWVLISNKVGIKTDLGFFIPGVTDLLKRSVLVFYFTIREMLNIRNWYIFWPIFGLSLLFENKNYSKIMGQLFPVFGILVLFFFFNYVFSFLEPRIYVASSIDRVLMQLSAFYYPIFVFKTRGLFAKIGV